MQQPSIGSYKASSAVPKSALLIRMIELLRTRPGIGVSELASSLDRSPRTIYRWLSELADEVGVAIYVSNGGYYIAGEAHSPGPLTPEELLALRTALRSQLFAEGSPLRQSAESAWLKIRDMSPFERVRRARELADSYSVHVTAPRGLLEPGVPRIIENAIAAHHRLCIVYRSQKSNQVKTYTVDPYALVFRRHSWYMLAHSSEHRKVVQFKLVRIREVTDTGVDFEPPADFSVEEYFRHSWEAWAGDEPIDVRVRFSPNVAAMVAETRRHPSQRVHPQPDGSIIFEVTVSGIEEIAIWILGFGKEAEALAPPELRAYVCDHVRGMVRLYGLREADLQRDDRAAATLTGQSAPLR